MTAVLPAPIVDAAWLYEHLGDVVIVDVRWRLAGPPGRDAYVAGHLPGAVFLDIDDDLASPASPTDGRHPLPSPDLFAAALGRLGIDGARPVVAYDDAGGSTAGRLWWLLTSIGESAAILDGGIASWTFPLSTDIPNPPTVDRAPRDWPADHFVDADQVVETAAGSGVVLDARASARYSDGDPVIDPRPGHIPGAKSAPWQGNLDPSTGRFLAPGELRKRFEALGVRPDAPTVVYCGSGVTACHDLLALTVAGFGAIALYPGSWSAWGADTTRPAVTGPEPGTQDRISQAPRRQA